MSTARGESASANADVDRISVEGLQREDLVRQVLESDLCANVELGFAHVASGVVHDDQALNAWVRSQNDGVWTQTVGVLLASAAMTEPKEQSVSRELRAIHGDVIAGRSGAAVFDR